LTYDNNTSVFVHSHNVPTLTNSSRNVYVFAG